MDLFGAFLLQAVNSLAHALQTLIAPAIVFIALSLAVKRRRAITDAFRSSSETRTNLLIHFLDALIVGPFLAFFVVAMSALLERQDLQLVTPDFWKHIEYPILVAFIAVFAGDFTGYWRHRLEHTWVLWPSHAIHHSDTEMTWLTLSRFHPINRLTTTAIDGAFLTLLGFPPYAIIINGLVRHYYGYFIHADLPWTYGPLQRLFVSPAMHRWHHALDEKAFNTNYATVFSCLDVAFGTYRVPGPCMVPLGVTDNMATGIVGQLAHPLKPSSYRRVSADNAVGPDSGVNMPDIRLTVK